MSYHQSRAAAAAAFLAANLHDGRRDAWTRGGAASAAALAGIVGGTP